MGVDPSRTSQRLAAFGSRTSQRLAAFADGVFFLWTIRAAFSSTPNYGLPFFLYFFPCTSPGAISDTISDVSLLQISPLTQCFDVSGVERTRSCP